MSERPEKCAPMAGGAGVPSEPACLDEAHGGRRKLAVVKPKAVTRLADHGGLVCRSPPLRGNVRYASDPPCSAS